jgi:5-methylcytosine-specific restriction protein A
MLRIITDSKEIADCQKLLQQKVQEHFTNKGEHNFGFRGGNHQGKLWGGERIWFTTVKITGEGDPVTGKKDSTPRYWNAFGLEGDIGKSSSVNIAVEVNIPLQGNDRSVGGFFAKNNISKRTFLLHRGRIGGGRKGIGKGAFLGWYPDNKKVNAFNADGSSQEAILITGLESKTFLEDLEGFVQNVADFKEAITLGIINEATSLDPAELKKRAIANGGRKGGKKTSTTVYDRNVYVSEWAKYRAKGKCQLCNKRAPFKYGNNRPFLETHHIKWLGKGGADVIDNTAALCPNCHRKMHVLNLEEDRAKLREAIS